MVEKKNETAVHSKPWTTIPAPGSREARIYRLNQARSPLLRLPPEIRNNIFKLALGGRRIHDMYMPYHHNWRQKPRKHYQKVILEGSHCRILSYPREETISRGADSCNNPYGIDCSSGVWEPCLDKGGRLQWRYETKTEGPGLTLLAPVCRQLYNETLLLPFELNVWSFDAINSMMGYIKRSNRPPLLFRRAIHTVMILNNYAPTETMKKYLPGLEYTICTEINGTLVTKSIDGQIKR